MSVGIHLPNMEMPKSCRKCMISQPDGCGWICPIIEGKPIVDGRVNSRHPHCPLVPVPPHGRLIDADALLMRINHEAMEAYMDGVCYGVHPSQEYLYLLGEIIDDTPTIIPAEEGE